MSRAEQIASADDRFGGGGFNAGRVEHGAIDRMTRVDSIAQFPNGAESRKLLGAKNSDHKGRVELVPQPVIRKPRREQAQRKAPRGNATPPQRGPCNPPRSDLSKPAQCRS